MTVKELIQELECMPENCPVYFDCNTNSIDIEPIVDVASGEDDTGEAVILS